MYYVHVWCVLLYIFCIIYASLVPRWPSWVWGYIIPSNNNNTVENFRGVRIHSFWKVCVVERHPHVHLQGLNLTHEMLQSTCPQIFVESLIVTSETMAMQCKGSNICRYMWLWNTQWVTTALLWKLYMESAIDQWFPAHACMVWAGSINGFTWLKVCVVALGYNNMRLVGMMSMSICCWCLN